MDAPPDTTSQQRGVVTRIVIGYDMSAEADRAADLVARTTWPTGSLVRLVTSSSGIGEERSSFSGRESKLHAADVRAALAAAQERVTTLLAGVGLVADAVTVGGKPARAVVDHARTFGADLIVVGAQRRSSLASALLGSVSMDIAASAPCPVLIVRVEALERVVLATDGSPAAAAAVDVVASWPLFANAELRVVGVAAPPSRYVAAVLDEVDDREAEELAATRERTGAVVDATVERLAAEGRRVVGDIRTGDAASEIVAASDDWPADLVVLGSSDGSFVRRLVLGSVARNVAQAVNASVLVVRAPPDRRPAAAAAGEPR